MNYYYFSSPLNPPNEMKKGSIIQINMLLTQVQDKVQTALWVYNLVKAIRNEHTAANKQINK